MCFSRLSHHVIRPGCKKPLGFRQSPFVTPSKPIPFLFSPRTPLNSFFKSINRSNNRNRNTNRSIVPPKPLRSPRLIHRVGHFMNFLWSILSIRSPFRWAWSPFRSARSPFGAANKVKNLSIASEETLLEFQMPDLIHFALYSRMAIVFATQRRSYLDGGITGDVNDLGDFIVESEFGFSEDGIRLANGSFRKTRIVFNVLHRQAVDADHIGMRTTHQVGNHRDRERIALDQRSHFIVPERGRY